MFSAPGIQTIYPFLETALSIKESGEGYLHKAIFQTQHFRI
jgi:hypothetical protein